MMMSVTTLIIHRNKKTRKRDDLIKSSAPQVVELRDAVEELNPRKYIKIFNWYSILNHHNIKHQCNQKQNGGINKGVTVLYITVTFYFFGE